MNEVDCIQAVTREQVKRLNSYDVTETSSDMSCGTKYQTEAVDGRVTLRRSGCKVSTNVTNASYTVNGITYTAIIQYSHDEVEKARPENKPAPCTIRADITSVRTALKNFIPHTEITDGVRVR